MSEAALHIGASPGRRAPRQGVGGIFLPPSPPSPPRSTSRTVSMILRKNTKRCACLRSRSAHPVLSLPLLSGSGFAHPVLIKLCAVFLSETVVLPRPETTLLKTRRPRRLHRQPHDRGARAGAVEAAGAGVPLRHARRPHAQAPARRAPLAADVARPPTPREQKSENNARRAVSRCSSAALCF